MATITGGERLVRALEAAGVETIFGLHGAHTDTIFQACLDHQLPIIDTRHEAAAGHAAEGYARAGNRLGVALVTAGGGFTNVVTPLANAFLDRTPLLVITGSGALRDAETNTLQHGIDQVAVARPITKWAHQITITDNIPRIVAQAARIAQTAPRGPVLLDCPWDVLMNQTEDTPVPEATEVDFRSAPTSAAVTRTLQLLDQARRPVIIVGADILRSGAGRALHSFIKGSGIPVFADYEGLGALAGCPHSGGLLQNLYTFDDQTGRPDVVLMLGLRFGLNTSHGTGLLVPHQATVIQVDSDARELGRLQKAALAIVADPGEMVFALDAAATGRHWPARQEWQQSVRAAIESRRKRVDSLAKEETPIHPMRAVAAIATAIDSDTVVVADGALSYLWLSEVISAAQPRAFLCHGYLGSMGVGMGIALGAQAATRGGRVLLVTGDGSVGYSLGEFDTMVRQGLPIVVVVMNNRSWGATLHFQRLAAGPDRITNTRLENGNYEDVAKALGARGVSVTRESEIAPAIAAAFASGIATCINVRVGLDAIPPEEMILLGQNPFA